MERSTGKIVIEIEPDHKSNVTTHVLLDKPIPAGVDFEVIRTKTKGSLSSYEVSVLAYPNNFFYSSNKVLDTKTAEEIFVWPAYTKKILRDDLGDSVSSCPYYGSIKLNMASDTSKTAIEVNWIGENIKAVKKPYELEACAYIMGSIIIKHFNENIESSLKQYRLWAQVDLK